MAMEELLNFISNNGLATVLCIYMVVVNTKTVQKNTEAVNGMKQLLETMMKKGE